MQLRGVTCETLFIPKSCWQSGWDRLCQGGTLSSWDRWEANGHWVSLKILLSGSSSAPGQDPELDMLHTSGDKEAGKYIVILFFSFT